MPGNPLKPAHYRPDIDGLRAIAVIAVILYHAQLACPGGFVGVDVFFVISGYLITRIVQKDINDGRFSLLQFYQRRIRRIFPALFVVLLFLALMGLRFLPPAELADLGKCMVAASAFGSNILFFHRSGYFEMSSLQQPLLHTWTLSVEEQFYIFWPWVLAALSWRPLARYRPWVVLLIIAGSLALSAYWVIYKTDAAFYLLPSRAWELAIGAIVSIAPVTALARSLPRVLAELAAATGLVMILSAIFLLNSLDPFPGFAALLPCTGAALVIAAGENGATLAGRILAGRPMVWTGLISYSLYLWHWPIFYFARFFSGDSLSRPQTILSIAIVFLVAWLSWRYIESPFRSPRIMGGGSRIWVLGGLATSAAFLIFGFVLMRSEGFPARGPAVAAWVNNQARVADTTLLHSPCFSWTAALPPAGGCLLGAPSGAKGYEAVLWGDSNAAHLAPALRKVDEQLGIVTRQITKAGCIPVMGIHQLPANRMTIDCPVFNDSALRTILGDPQVGLVIIGARWQRLVEQSQAARPDNKALSVSDSRNLFVACLRSTLETLAKSGRQVILMGEIPEATLNPVTCIARARFNHWSAAHCESMASSADKEEVSRVQAALQEAAVGISNVQIIEPSTVLCGGSQCRLADQGEPLYWDVTHLSAAGAALLAPELQKHIQSAFPATTTGVTNTTAAQRRMASTNFHGK